MNNTLRSKLNTSMQGFTLVEMLMVLAIMALLAVFSIPAFTRVRKSSSLGTTGVEIEGFFSLARQRAMTENCIVEVRFFYLPDTQSGGGKTYRSIQTYKVSEDGSSYSPLDKVYYLPREVQFRDDLKYSSLLDAATVGIVADPLAGLDYHVFRFRPDGSTDLDPGKNWFITIVPKEQTQGEAGNYFSIQVDALTGKVQSFRP